MGLKQHETVKRGSDPPRLISWNITLRCPLKCAHCYVDAGATEPDDVLTTDEAEGVIDQICDVGSPILILSGGEPLLREDILRIIRYGTGRGLRMVMGTSGYGLDPQMAEDLKEAGLKAAAISIDSTDPSLHDAFRGVDGAWEQAVAAIRNCRDAGIGIQINMTVMRPSLDEVDAVIRMGREMGVTDYHIFFPVHTGRGEGIAPQNPLEYESMIADILRRYEKSGLSVRPICAPQFRRIGEEHGISDGGWGRGCLAGISYCRIYATGEVTPCPYLPVSAGNLREMTFSDIWTGSPLFIRLRDPDQLTGKCGICMHRTICGGCRARAYAGTRSVSTRWCDGLRHPEMTDGDPTSDDPWCPYIPAGWSDTA